MEKLQPEFLDFGGNLGPIYLRCINDAERLVVLRSSVIFELVYLPLGPVGELTKEMGFTMWMISVDFGGFRLIDFGCFG